MPDRSNNSHISSIVIPYYGRVALSVLPSFLEVIGKAKNLWSFTFRKLKKMEFNPAQDDKWPDPSEGRATFYFPYDERTRLVITVVYRPGEEGTRGSVDKIRTIELFLGNKHKIFYYLEHHCCCRYCKGIKYPFLPENVDPEKFENMPEDEQLVAIIRYLEEA